MKLTTGILIMGMAATAWGQNPDAIQNTRDTMKSVQLKKQIDSNAALGDSKGGTPQPASAPVVKSVAAQGTASGPFDARKPSAHKAKAAHKAHASRSQQQLAVENGTPVPDAPLKTAPVNLASRRDPFVSPVVNQSASGSGCSTGKRCLAIDQIALKGVVKSDGGMIAVVVNALDKAYFLHENDPVFNGYVVKITGDSIVFKETVQDKIGHPFTREVTKKITTPAV